MSKYVGGLPTLKAHQPVNPNSMAEQFDKAGQKYVKDKKLESAQKVVNDPHSTPIQKALALASIGQEKLGSDVYKKAADESLIGGVEQRLQQRLQGGTAQEPARDRSWVPDMTGRTPPIRDAGQASSAQPAAQGFGSPTQPGFTPGAPSRAASNATAIDSQIPSAPPMRPPAPMAPQVAPQEVAPEEKAEAYDEAARELAKTNPSLARFYENKSNNIQKSIRADKIADAKRDALASKALLDIHKSEKAAYDNLESEGQQAKKTSRARETMIAQLATGKLNPGNLKNLFANMFKGSPTLEGLFTTPEREVFKSAGISQFEGMKEIFGVRLSDADLAIASTKVMDPTKPVAANIAIAKYWDFSDKMKIQEANIAREVKKENNGFLPINWREQVHERMQERFGDEAQKITQDAASEGGSRPLKIIDDKVAIIAPDGRRKLVPQQDLKKYLLAGGMPE